jgi:hypothetical protein
MKRTMLLCAAFMMLFVLPACDKDDDNNDNIVQKSGLPIGGDQEVPARITSATGSMNVSYDKTAHVLSYTINWQNLTDVPTGSHIHGPAPRGANAGIKHDFFSQFPKNASGTYSGSVTVDETAIKEDSLLNGFYYVNIHTATYPGGEIRGQIEF